MAERESEQSVGALWMKEGAKGTYFTGSFEIDGGDRNGGETIRIVAFKNGHKTSDKHPDFKIFKSRPKADAVPGPRRANPEDTDEGMPW